MIETSIFVHRENGGTWYCVQGSLNVNFTQDHVSDGVNVETLRDTGTYTEQEPIQDLADWEMSLDDEWLDEFYLDYFNSYLTVSCFALNRNMTEERANELLTKARKLRDA